MRATFARNDEKGTALHATAFPSYRAFTALDLSLMSRLLYGRHLSTHQCQSSIHRMRRAHEPCRYCCVRLADARWEWCRFAQSASASGQPFVVEYYYKAKWGHADEFLALFKKNHYPVLKKEIELGRFLKVWLIRPATTQPRMAGGTIA